MSITDWSRSQLRWRLFALSFIALFLELMIIRWSPSVVRLIAYYANLMLISSFLGLGIGAMVAQRRRIMGWFPLLLALLVLVLELAWHAVLPGSNVERRFFLIPTQQLLNYTVLLVIFAANTLVFVPLGQQIGWMFNKLPTLQAYSWDLGGSLCGTLSFGLFSFTYFSPLLGMATVMLVFLWLCNKGARLWTTLIFAGTLLVLFIGSDHTATWSPYYYITIHNNADRDAPGITSPQPNIRTMINPPSYIVRVNQDFYQPHGTIDPMRYMGTKKTQAINGAARYLLPYILCPGRERVLVVGAGGGTDAEAALLAGVKHVDAVEIDPVLVKLSKKFNAAGVYDDPRVQVHVNDGRAYLRNAPGGCDLVVFGWLDSQALFSQMSNIRLDGYIYTVESMRSAYALLNDKGMLSLSFFAGQRWMAEKLIEMLEEATGKRPIIYLKDGGEIILCVPKGPVQALPQVVGEFRLQPADIELSKVDVPTDDWPYLYLSKRTIPSDYLIVIASLVVLSLIAIVAIRGRGVGAADGHFFFLGLGFMLLETTSITNCSLYFGTTWLVTMLVVAGVLIMVLAANLVAMRMKRFSLALYVPLIVILLVLYGVPRDYILSLPLAGRLLWTLLVVPLPVFFAGLIFSTTFRDSANASLLLGANLVGAMIGGFCEYLGMAAGNKALALIVIWAYVASLLCRILLSRGKVSLSSLASAGAAD